MGNLHQGGPDHAVVEAVPGLHFLDDGAFLVLIGLLAGNRLVLGRVELFADRRDGRQALGLKDIVELADRYETPIRTALRLDTAPEDAILRQARLGSYDLVVMGVGRPAGETLYFGNIAAAMLENSQHSMLFVSS